MPADLAYKALIGGEIDLAIKQYLVALKDNKSDPLLNNNIAVAYMRKGDAKLAIKYLKIALKSDPKYVDALSNYGLCLNHIKKYSDAVSYLKSAIDIDINHALSYNELICSFLNLANTSEAVSCFKRLLKLRLTSTHFINLFKQLLPFRIAYDFLETAFIMVLGIYPKSYELHFLYSKILADTNNLDKSIQALKLAYLLNPADSEVVIALSVAYSNNRQLELAINTLKSFNGSKECSYFYNLGLWYSQLRDKRSALANFEIAYEIDPFFPCLASQYFHLLSSICDWGNSESVYSFIEENYKSLICVPYDILHRCEDPYIIKYVTQKFSNWMWPDVPHEKFVPYRNKKIKVAYFSADIYEHATSYLMANVFELHDKDKFEIYCFDYSPSKNDELRDRVIRAFDYYEHVGHLTDEAIAKSARDLQIDIAIDLKGYTTDSRLGIMRFHAAPIQIHLLGYPGTLGAPYMQYIVGDKFTTPLGCEKFYTEKLIRMPDSYQMNDPYRSKPILDVKRSDYGLPDNAFVLCCFNNNFKITKNLYDVWLEILSNNENAVLWLFEDNLDAKNNLLKYAQDHGDLHNKIYFAGRVRSIEHLSRHKLVDLFVDTFPYNAHTTASDVLWVGQPMVTCATNTFSGRVAGSLLQSMGLDDYIAYNLEDYKSLIQKIVSDKNIYEETRSKFSRCLINPNIFNSEKYTKDFEAILVDLFESHAR